jgi:hypothetical protein
MESSTYLYNDENRDLYEKVLEDISKTNCRHTNLLIASRESGTECSEFLKRHLVSCFECQAALRTWDNKLSRMRLEIPYKKIAEKDLKLLNAECFQLVEQSRKFKRIEGLKKRIEFGKQFKVFTLDLMRTLLTGTMFKGMLVALVAAIFVHYLI